MQTRSKRRPAPWRVIRAPTLGAEGAESHGEPGLRAWPGEAELLGRALGGGPGLSGQRAEARAAIWVRDKEDFREDDDEAERVS